MARLGWPPHNAVLVVGLELLLMVVLAIVTIDRVDPALFRWGLLAAMLILLLTGWFILWIELRFMAPLQLALGVVQAVEAGELNARIPVTADGEMGQLQQGINTMIDRLGRLLERHCHYGEHLGKQSELLQSIIEHAPVRVFWKDRSLRYIGCNSQFARDAGMKQSLQLIGKTDLDLCWREQAELYRADDRAVLESGLPKLEFEEPQTTPEGRTQWLSTSKVPLRAADGQVIGVLGIYTDITARKRAEQQIHELANYDALTRLPNRQLLLDRLQQAMAASVRHQQYAALLMLDLDHFKDLNDSQGHGVGDELLVEVAGCLRALLPHSDTVARLGGDEFVVITEELGQEESSAAMQARSLAEKVCSVLASPFQLKGGGLTHYITPSIGVTLFLGEETSQELLLKQADVAMYQAKGSGRNAIRFFNTMMQTGIDERASLALGLRRGLEQGELQLYYQPQVDHQGKIIGAEALLRWLPPDGKSISPALFIPLAEETSLILPIGAWVLKQACQQLRRWQADPDTRALTLAINVSAHQFRQADFVQQVRRQVEESGIDPSRLKLELTESAMLSSIDEVADSMRRLQGLGIGFSLDDFGTGFSSLTYLKQLPIEQLKIDYSFIRDILQDPGDATIVRAILAMSQSLGLGVIAEGVESEAQHAFLLQHGCRYFQGYLFGRPMPIGEWPVT